MEKHRLDQAVVAHGLAPTRSQAESYIRLGNITVNGKVILKPGHPVTDADRIELAPGEQYVSRAGLKLASAARALGLDFTGLVVLDVGSSTGGFTDYALRHGARKVIAVDVGTEQLHQSLRDDLRIELHEKTDIRAFQTEQHIDIVVADVSFISLRDILPAVARLVDRDALIVAMVKPQFEAGNSGLKHNGVIKNDHVRRDILKRFEHWAKQSFVVIGKADSAVAGARGNLERFYILRRAQ